MLSSFVLTIKLIRMRLSENASVDEQAADICPYRLRSKPSRRDHEVLKYPPSQASSLSKWGAGGGGELLND